MSQHALDPLQPHPAIFAKSPLELREVDPPLYSLRPFGLALSVLVTVAFSSLVFLPISLLLEVLAAHPQFSQHRSQPRSVHGPALAGYRLERALHSGISLGLWQ